MKRILLLPIFNVLAMAGMQAQISGPATAGVGVPVTFTGPSGQQTYTWSEGPMTLDKPAAGSLTPTAINTAVTYPHEIVVQNDNGHWYGFVIRENTKELVRVDLGTDPTAPSALTTVLGNFLLNTNAPFGFDMIKDSASGKWYGFAVQQGTGATAACVRFDFGTSLANTPAAVTVTLPSSSASLSANVNIVKYGNEWILFVGNRWGGPIRIDLGTDITNTAPSAIQLPAASAAPSTNTSIAIYKQGSNWYGLAVHTSYSNIIRYDFGTDLKNNTPATTVVGSNVIGNTNNWNIKIVAGGDCGKDLYAYVLSNNLKRLEFPGGDITATPVNSTALLSANFSSTICIGLYPYVYNGTLHAMLGSLYQGIYDIKLSDLPASVQHKYNTPFMTTTFAAGGTYTINLVTNMDGGKSQTYCHTINVAAGPPAQPDPYTSAPANVCRGDAGVTYTVPVVSGATGYEWVYSGGTGVTFSGTSSTAAPTNDLTFSGTATSGTLRVRAVSSGGQSTYRDTFITVNALPAVSVSPSATQAICDGDSVTLTAAASNVNYQWKRNGTTNVGTDGTYKAKTQGDYAVTVTDKTTGCAATSGSVTVNVNPLPTVTVSPSATQTICAGDSVTLTATAGNVNYQWKRNGTTNVGTDGTYKAKTQGSYTVTVTDKGTSCAATSGSVTVNVNPLPTVTVSPSTAQAICDGDSVKLTAAAGNVNYQWKLNGTTNVGTASTYDAKTQGSYAVTVTDKGSGCFSTSGSVTVTVNPLPTATVSVGGTGIACAGDSVVLTAGQGSGYSYQWKNGSGNVGTNSRTYGARTTGDYKVVVTDGATQCRDSTAPVSVTVLPRPSVTLEPGDTSFCAGGIVTLNVSTQDTGLTYRWKNGQTTIPLAQAYFLEINETGTYRVIVGRSAVPGCEDSTNTVTVTVHPLPVPATSWDGAVLHTEPAYASYQWNTGGQGIAGATDSTFRPSSDGDYSVTVVDSNGCTGTSPVRNLRNVSVDVLTAGDIRIYPNPVTGGTLYIETDQEVSVMLSGMDGKTLLQGRNIRSVDMSGYAGGVYLLRILDRDGILLHTARIVNHTYVK